MSKVSAVRSRRATRIRYVALGDSDTCRDDTRITPAGTPSAPGTIMRSSLMTVVLGATLLTTACATKSGTGTAVGGAAGGVLGYAVGGTTGLLIGAAAGGLFGYGAGKAMEEEDRRRAAIALEQNRAASWRNPETGYEYRVEPTDTRYLEGRECRDFRVLADVEGSPEQLSGTACRQPDGSWQMLSG
jgi:surface antigen